MYRFLHAMHTPRDTSSAVDMVIATSESSRIARETAAEEASRWSGWTTYAREIRDATLLYFRAQRSHWSVAWSAWRRCGTLFVKDTVGLVLSFVQLEILFYMIVVGVAWSAVCYFWSDVLEVMTVMFELLGDIFADIVKLVNIIIGIFHSLFGFICNDFNFHKCIGWEHCFFGHCIGFHKCIGIDFGGWACSIENAFRPLDDTSADSIFPFLPSMKTTSCNAYESIFTLPRILIGALLGGELESVIDNSIFLALFFYLPVILIGITVLYGIYHAYHPNVYTRRAILGVAMIASNPTRRARVPIDVLVSEFEVQHGKRTALRGRDPDLKVGTPTPSFLKASASRWNVWSLGAMGAVVVALVFFVSWGAVRGEAGIRDVFTTMFWLFLSPTGPNFRGFPMVFCSITCFGYLILFFALLHVVTMVLDVYHATLAGGAHALQETALLLVVYVVLPLLLAARWVVGSLPWDAFRGVCCRHRRAFFSNQ